MSSIDTTTTPDDTDTRTFARTTRTPGGVDVLPHTLRTSEDVPDSGRGWVSLETVHIRFDARHDNVASVNLLTPPSGKRRALIPSMFSGLVSAPDDVDGAQGSMARSPSNDVFSSPKAYASFLGLKLPAGMQVTWGTLSDFVASARESAWIPPEQLTEKKTEVLNANKDLNPRLASDSLPKMLLDSPYFPGIPTSLQAGMGIFGQHADGILYQLTHQPRIAESMCNKDSNAAWLLHPEATRLLFRWITRNKAANGGLLWGRLKVFEEA